MQLIPRRKRTWLLVLLGIVIVGAAEIWWAATKKSEFEGKFGQIAIGISKEVALQLMPDDQASVFQSVPPVALARQTLLATTYRCDIGGCVNSAVILDH